MAKKTLGTFRVPGGFTIQSNKPIRDSETVEFLSDLTSPTELPDIYEGISVYVEEVGKHFFWNGLDRTSASNWKVIGEGDKTFVFSQNTPSIQWSITHNLNKLPSVNVIDSAENKVIGDVEYIDNNNLIITFSSAFSGKATLN